MNSKVNQNSYIKKDHSIANNSIILFFSILSLFLESIVIIMSLLKKGIFKKEILSEKTNLGFDLVIKRK
jgi:hypothetical protein